jgi:ribosomal protein S18 acetylase RimI-like enzyme
MKATNAFLIRRATVEDYPAIAEVWRKSGSSIRPHTRDSERAFREQLHAFADSYLVAVEADRMIGVVLGTHDLRKGWINRLAVLPEYRRRGVGAALVQACEDALRALGIPILAALVEQDNAPSAALFQRLGYREDVPVRYFRKVTHPDG